MISSTATTVYAQLLAYCSGLRQRALGFLICAALAGVALLLSQTYGAPPMLFALLIGIAFQFLAEKERYAVGIEFSSKKLLRFGVALLGLRITVDQVLSLGLDTVGLLAGGVVLTILFGIGIAKLTGGRASFGTLTGGAVAICGASAALAISAILPKSKHGERDLSFTVIAITTYSTAAMILYPLLAGYLGLEDKISGIFLGGTIHDVTQVVGAGYTISEEAGDIATITKLFRVTMLVPVVLVLAMLLCSERKSVGQTPVPLFVVAFCILVALNSGGMVPVVVSTFLIDLSRWCLVTAIAALGMKTSLKAITTIGFRPVAIVIMESLFIAAWVLVGLQLLN